MAASFTLTCDTRTRHLVRVTTPAARPRAPPVVRLPGPGLQGRVRFRPNDRSTFHGGGHGARATLTALRRSYGPVAVPRGRRVFGKRRRQVRDRTAARATCHRCDDSGDGRAGSRPVRRGECDVRRRARPVDDHARRVHGLRRNHHARSRPGVGRDVEDGTARAAAGTGHGVPGDRFHGRPFDGGRTACRTMPTDVLDAGMAGERARGEAGFPGLCGRTGRLRHTAPAGPEGRRREHHDLLRHVRERV